MNPADYVKVHFPGEWPWVYRVRETEDELIGRVDNYLVFTENHGFKFNDIVRFKKIDDVWEAQERMHGLSVITNQ